MLNFTTKKEYQGSNVDQLSGLGNEFCTFHQAVDYFKLTGKELKGAKSCARLMKIVEREVFDKIGDIVSNFPEDLKVHPALQRIIKGQQKKSKSRSRGFEVSLW